MEVKINIKEKEFKELLNYLYVIVDTRENENKDIIKFFKKKKIDIERKKLEFGDYSFGIRNNPIFNRIGLSSDISFENKLAIETKASLEEISGNLTRERERLKDEFTRAKIKNCEIHVLIENATLDDIYAHNYQTRFNEKAFVNSIISFGTKYNLKFEFISSKYSGYHIYQTFLIYLKNFISK